MSDNWELGSSGRQRENRASTRSTNRADGAEHRRDQAPIDLTAAARCLCFRPRPEHGWLGPAEDGSTERRGDVLRFAEMLNPDGTVYTITARRDRHVYIERRARSCGVHSRFTAFDMWEIFAGTIGSRRSMRSRAWWFTLQMQRTGSFECSSPLVNQLVHNIVC